MTTRGRDRPVEARRPWSNSAIAGRNSPAPTSATGPGMAVSLPGVLAEGPVAGCDTASVTSRQRWTLVATVIGSGAVFLDGTDRQRRPARRSARTCRPASSASSRARTTSSAATSRSSPRCSSCRAACPITTAAGASTRIGLVGFAGTSALCGLAPTLEWLVMFRLLQGGGRRAAGPGLDRPHHPRLRGRGARPRVRDLGRFDIGADRARTDHRRDPGRHDRLAGGVPHQRPGPRRGAVGDPWPRRGVARHGGERPVRLARRVRRGPRGRRPVVRAHPGRGQGMAGPARVGGHRRRASSPSSRSRSSWRGGRIRSCR